MAASWLGIRGIGEGRTASLPHHLFKSIVDDEPRLKDEILRLADRAKARLERIAWVASMQDGCTEIQVLAHSLGTLVAFHAMNSGSIPTESPPRGETCAATLTRFHTIGSPLEKIHFFWPRLVSPHGDKPALYRQGPQGKASFIGVDPDFSWRNYYSKSDIVSGKLRRFCGWGDIKNKPLSDLGGLLSAHLAYDKNNNFLRVIAKELGVNVSQPISGWLRALLGWAWSTFQNMLLPLIAAGVILSGVAFLAGISAAIAAMLTVVGSMIGKIIGIAVNWWYWKSFFWLTAIFFVSINIHIAHVFPGWAKRVAYASVARWWRNIKI